MKKIRFKCDNCRELLSVSEKFAGKRVKCPKCANPTNIPEAINKVSEPDELEILDDNQKAPPTDTKRYSRIRPTKRTTARRRRAASAQKKCPGIVKALAIYYIIGALFFGILVPIIMTAGYQHEKSIRTDWTEQDASFMSGIFAIMTIGTIFYASLHFIAGIGLLKLKKWGYNLNFFLTLFGLCSFNPFLLPGLICLYRPAFTGAFGVEKTPKEKSQTNQLGH